MALKNKCLFSDDILAWHNGAAVESAYYEYRNFGAQGIDDSMDNRYPYIGEKTNNILEEVYDVFGQYSAWRLRGMMRNETPWKQTEQNHIISTDLIRDYFIENYIE